jgi:membrane-bound lytic murein transglycosylase B
MKRVTLELPDKIASIFESLPSTRKANAALLAAAFAQSKQRTTDSLFTEIDERVADSGISEDEINRLLNELS